MYKQLGIGRSTLAALSISFAILCLTLIPGTYLIAQTDTGRVQGSVAAPSGAVIPGATLTLTNTDTNASQTVTSDAAGNFNVPALPRGTYKAQISAEGFDSQTQTFTLQVSQIQALNFKLSPGAASTVVEVNNAAPPPPETPSLAVRSPSFPSTDVTSPNSLSSLPASPAATTATLPAA